MLLPGSVLLGEVVLVGAVLLKVAVLVGVVLPGEVELLVWMVVVVVVVGGDGLVGLVVVSQSANYQNELP